ncbi:VOC family protein [Sphingosinicella sp. YJ22]|uniref:VOC family protein n=1 Tax=Sphingosinicella sp. YJ22 TaxID=1104780 RepID=UPI00140D91A5|nr:VOC family protein [Sphingosinicella sp. YJ22]
MAKGILEHVNVTVSDPRRTAEMLERLFSWSIRWEGPAKLNGRTVHVGTDDAYVALWSPPPGFTAGDEDSRLNHIGVVVDDLDATERKVIAEGFTPQSHADYDPGRRFYFDDSDGIEFEVVSYA